jgi:hypothetical protein
MTPASLLKFLNAARSLAKQGFKQEDIIKFAKQEFGEVTDLVRLQINKIFKTKNQPSVGIKTKDPVFDNTVETIPFDDTGTPFNPKNPQKVYGKPREGIKTLDEAEMDIKSIDDATDELNDAVTEADAFSESIGFPTATKKIKNKAMTPDELENFELELGDNLEAYDFDGTVEDGARILREQKKYTDDMFLEYKKGNLDPVAGDTSPARKRFLEKKLEEMEMSGDTKLMDPDEIEELSTFDLGTDMDNAKLSVNDEIKRGVDEIMSDTSPAALKKSIEVDDLMLKYPGMSRELAKQIASDPDPARKAQVISMVEQTIKMGDEGMSGDEIIDIFKKGTDRTKQAKGGRIKMAKGGLPNILGF